ncbi:MAG: hypothetical protein KDB18_10675 [Salinibacterium sp.]|nr:hypothetical protein [Cryobacterium sp.]MCB1281975.1 hypothetical protein [Salinibacterium sp.]
MQQTYTSVLTRRLRVDSDFATLPYEAGWASEAVFFVQTEGDHPDLALAAEVSPDGIHWIRRGSPVVLDSDAALAELPVTGFGNWLRVTVTGATPDATARLLIHVNLKG